MCCGIQRGYKEIVRGMQVDMQMQPKIKFEIVVSSEEWEVKTIEAIEKAAYTGCLLYTSTANDIGIFKRNLFTKYFLCSC